MLWATRGRSGGANRFGLTAPAPARATTAVSALAAVVMALGLALVMAGCSLLPMEEEALRPPLLQPAEEELDIIAASRGSIQTYLRGTAFFVSSSTETLSFKQSGGRLKAIAAAVGQRVAAGDLLVELETGDLELQLQLQELNVERARLQYSQARAAGASEADVRLREIDMEREQLVLDAMASTMTSSRLYAPISGIVTFVESLHAGDTVQAHQSLVTVADPERIQLTYVAASRNDLFFLVEAGMPAKLRYKGRDYVGSVMQTPANAPLTDDEAKAGRDAVTIIVSMDDQPDDVQIGHSAELTIELQNREHVIVLPRSAVRSYMGRHYVQVIEGERRREVDVEVGLTTATELEIVSGLTEGQQIILNN